MPKAMDLTGDRFGRWIVLERVPEGKKTKYLCRCVCGTEKLVAHGDLRSGKSKSCGCLKRDLTIRRNTTHNESHHTRLWRIWNNMRSRCKYPSTAHWNRYGGRGIDVCEEWDVSYESFKNWALVNGYSDELTIDRINNDGNYEPSNCRWVTPKEQSLNRSNNHMVEIEGEEKPLDEWSRIFKRNPKTVRDRLKRGWSYKRALTTPTDERWSR